MIGTAWSAVGLAMSALQFKASIGAAVVSTVWKYSAGVVSTAWSAVMATLSTAFSSAAWLAGAAVTTAAWVASAGAIAVAIFGLDAVLITTATAATVAWGAGFTAVLSAALTPAALMTAA
ncbi:hypothetical protein, partial [Novipirellula maiorica]|uniref:hypothetical protein n=1 Tax=Novipirellula maiorica TaxID=1265734 RepID=UPI001F454EE6